METPDGTKAKPYRSMKTAYEQLTGDEETGGYVIKVITAAGLLTVEANTFAKKTGITIEGVDNAAVEEETNTKVEINYGATLETDLFTCKEMVTFKHLVFGFSATSGQTEGVFALIHAAEGSVSLTIETCEFKRPGSGDNIGIHLVRVSAGSLTMTGVGCADEENVASFTATPFLVDGTTSTVTLTGLNLEKITSSSSAVMKITSTSEVEISLNKCTFTECTSSDTTTATSGALYVESENAGSTFTIGGTDKTTFTSCTCTNGKSGGIYLKMTGIAGEKQLSWGTGVKLEFSECTATGSKSTGLYLEVPVNLHENIAATMKSSFAQNYKRTSHESVVVAKGENNIEVDFTAKYFDPEEPPASPSTMAYVQSGEEMETPDGTKAKPYRSMKTAYEQLTGDEETGGYVIKVITAAGLLTVEANTFAKKTGITIEGVDNAAVEEETNTKVEINYGATLETDLFTCKEMVTFKHLVFGFSATSGQTEGVFALIHAAEGSVSLTIETCEFKRPGSGDNIGIHLVRVSAGSLTMTGVGCADEENVASFTATPFLVDGTTSTVTLTGLNLEKITSSSSAVMKITSTSEVEISLNKCTFTECTSSDTTTATSGALYVESENAGSTFTIGGTDKTTFTSCTCTNGKSGGIYLKMTGIAGEKQLSWGTGVKLEFSECTATGSKSTGLYLEVPVNLHENIAATMKSSFAQNYKRTSHESVVVAKGENNIEVDFTAKYFDPEEPPASPSTMAYVQSGEEMETPDGTKAKPYRSMKTAYEQLTGDEETGGYVIKVITAAGLLTVEANTFAKKTGITIEGVDNAAVEEETNTKVEINYGATLETDLFTCKEMVTFKHLVFGFSATSGQTEGVFALIHAAEGSVSLTIETCEFKRPGSGDNIGIHLVRVSAGSLTMTGVGCADEENVASFTATPFLVDGTTSTVTLTGLNLEKITSSSSAVMKITSTSEVEISLNKCTFTECTSSDTTTATSGALYVESENAGSTFTIGGTDKTTFTSCTCTNGKSGGIYLKMTGIAGEKQLSWGTGVKLEFSECTATGSKSTGLYLEVPVNLHENIAATMKSSFAQNYKRTSHESVVVAKGENNIEVDFTAKYFDPEEPPASPSTMAYVQSGEEMETPDGTKAKPYRSMKTAYEQLTGDEETGGYVIKVITAAGLLTVEANTFAKKTGITIEGVDNAAVEEETNTKVEINYGATLETDLFTCKEMVTFKHLVFGFSATSGQTEGVFALIHAAEGSVSLTIETCEFKRPGSGDNIGIHLVRVSAGSLTMTGVGCADEENVASFTATPFLVDGTTSTVTLTGLNLEKITSSSSAVMKITSTSEVEISLNKCTFTECTSSDTTTATSGALYVESENAGSTFTIGGTDKTTFTSCTCTNGKSGGIYLKMTGIAGEKQLSWGTGVKLEFSECTATGSKSTGLYLEVPVNLHENIAATMKSSFAQNYKRTSHESVVVAKGENNIEVDFTAKYFDPEEPPASPSTMAYVQSGEEMETPDGTKAKPYRSMKTAYEQLTGDEETGGYVIKVITAAGLLTVEANTFAKKTGITIEGVDNAAVEEETNTKVEINYGATLETDLFTCKEMVTFKHLVFGFSATSGQTEGVFALIHAAEGSVSLTIETCEFKRPGSGDNIGIHLVRVSAGSLTMTGVGCADEENVASFTATPFLVDGTTSTVTLTGLNLEKITSSSSAVMKITSTSEVEISLNKCTFTECTSSDTTTATSGALYVESENAGSTFTIGGTDKTTFTSCTCTNGKSGGIYLKMTGIAGEKQLSWGTGVKLEFSECTATGSKSTGLYLEVPVNLHENIAATMKSSFAQNYKRTSHESVVVAKGENNIEVDFTAKYFDPEEPPASPSTMAYVQSGEEMETPDGTKAKPYRSMKTAYEQLTGDEETGGYVIKVITAAGLLTVEANTFAKKTGITIEGVDNAAVEEETNTKVEINYGATLETDLFTCKEMVTFKHLVFGFSATSGQTEGVFALIHAAEGSVSLTIETCEFKRPGSGDNIGIHLVRVSAGSLTMTGVGCADEENVASFTATPFLVDGTTSTVTLTGLNLEKITSSSSAVMKITSTSEVEISLNKCTFTECTSSDTTTATSGALYVESENAGSTFTIGGTDKTTFTSCTCTNGKSGGIYLKMTGIAGEKQLSWGTGVKLEFSECTATGSKSTGLYLEVPVNLHENIAATMKSSFAQNYKRTSHESVVVAKGENNIEVDFTAKYFDPEEPPASPSTMAYVQSGEEMETPDGTKAKPYRSMKTAYEQLTGDEETGGYVIKVITAAGLLTVEANTFAKKTGITIEGVDNAAVEEETNTKVEINYGATLETDLFTCKEMVTFKHLVFGFSATSGQTEGVFALIHAAEGSVSLTIETCEFKRPGSGDNIGIHLVRVSAGSLTMTGVGCADEENVASFTATPFLVDGTTSTVTLTGLNLEKITSSSSAVMKITSTSEVEISLNKCTFTECTSSDTTTATSGALYVESENAGSTFTIGGTDKTTFTSCTCTNGKSGGIYLKMTGIAGEKQLSWGTGVKLEFSECTATGSKSTGLYLEVPVNLHENIAATMKSSFAQNYKRTSHESVVVAKGENNIEVDFTAKYFDPEEPPASPSTMAYVQSGEEMETPDGTKAKPYRSMKTAYEQLTGDEETGGYVIKVITAAGLLTVEANTFAKKTGITIEGVDNAAVEEETNTKVEINYGATLETDLFTCKEMVTFKHLVFGFSATSGQTEGVFALIHAAEGSVSLTIETCEFKRPGSGDNIGIHLVRVSAGSLTMTGVGCADEENVASFTATPFLVDGTTSTVTLTGLNLEKITSSSSAVMKITSTSEVEISLNKCTFTECTSSDTTTATSGALYVESENAGSTFTIGGTDKTTFTSCTCTNGKSGGIYLKMTGIAGEKQLSWGTGVKLEFSECTATGSKSTGLYLEVPVNLHENIAATMKSSFAQNYKRTSHESVVVAKGENNIEVDFTAKYFDPEEPPASPSTMAYVQSGEEMETPDGTKAKPYRSMKTAYEQLTGDEETGGYVIKVITAAGLLTVEANTFAKKTGITIEGVDNAAVEEETNTKVEINYGATLETDLFTCKEMVTFKHLVFGFSATSGQTEGVFALIHAAEGSVSLTIETCEFKRPGSGDNIGIHLVRVSAGSLTMTGVGCADEENVASFTATPFLVDGTTSTVTLTGLNLEKITSSSSAVMKITSTSEVEISLNKCTFTECTSSDTTTATSGALYVESENAGSTFTIGGTDKTTFTSCTCTNGKSGGIYLKMTGIAGEKQLSWGTGVKLEFSECTATGSKSTGLYLEVPVNLHENIAATMKSSFAQNYKRTSHESVVVAKGENNIEVDFTAKYFDPEEPPASPSTMAYVQSGEEMETPDGTKAKPYRSMKTAYEQLTGDEETGGYVIKVITAAGLLTVEANTFAKKTGITIEGVDNAAVEEETNTKVEINYGATLETDLFTCKEMVTFKHLVFGFSATSGQTEGVFALIHAAEGSVSLTIETCEFKRPGSGDNIGIHLVRVSAGSLTMTGVGCADEENVASFTATPFLVDGTTSTVTLTGLNLEKITSSSSAVMKITSTSEVEISLNKCTFTECTSSDTTTATSGALYVESENAGSTFTIGGTDKTTFTSCTCTNGKSGGIYLKMTGIAGEKQLSWGTGVKLEFSECTATGSKSTGLYLEVPVNLHENIAATMKSSFAQNYKRTSHESVVVAKGENNIEVDFTAKYFDPEQPPKPPTQISIVYVKYNAESSGLSFNEPIGSLMSAYNLFSFSSNLKMYSMRIIANDDMIKAETISFERSEQLTIEGIINAEGKNEIAKMDCKINSGSNLFTCKKSVTFKYLSFAFPLSLKSNGKSQFNEVTDSLALIVSEGGDSKLTINDCVFVRPNAKANEGENIADIHLVKVKAGDVSLETVSCVDGESKASFQKPLIDIEGAKRVILKGVKVSNVEVEDGAAISIADGSGEASSVVIDGLNMESVESKNSETAALMIKMTSETSSVELGREEKCSFKSCKAPQGKSGAAFIEMKNSVTNLKLPAEGKLDIDETNTGSGSKSTSLCIVAPDFEEFSKQDGAFEFAKDYKDENSGWIVGAKDETSKPVDVYENYLKKEEPAVDPEPDPLEKADNKKSNGGVIAVAIVVPIVFVAVVVAVVIIYTIQVRKRRSKYMNDSEDEQSLRSGIRIYSKEEKRNEVEMSEFHENEKQSEEQMHPVSNENVQVVSSGNQQSGSNERVMSANETVTNETNQNSSDVNAGVNNEKREVSDSSANSSEENNEMISAPSTNTPEETNALNNLQTEDQKISTQNK